MFSLPEWMKWSPQESYYATVAREPYKKRQSLSEYYAEQHLPVETADVCVVGGGVAGLCTALSLSERGLKVVLIESETVGWSSSALNAGFLTSDYSLNTDELEASVGLKAARRMVQEAADALKRTVNTIYKYDIQCDLTKTGAMVVSHYKPTGDELENVERENKNFGKSLKFLSKADIQSIYKSDMYHYGILDPMAYTMNPLSYVRGLARACEQNGVKIFERTRATEYKRDTASTDANGEITNLASPTRKLVIHTICSTPKIHDIDEDIKSTIDECECVVAADNVVLATGSHMTSKISDKIKSALVKNYTYIVVTEALGEERMNSLIKANHAVNDNRFALGYYRPLPDTRLLYGGLVSAFPMAKETYTNKLRHDLANAYPSLGDVKIDFAWCGPLSWAYHMMPLIGKLEDGIWYIYGLGGDGLIGSSIAGDVVAESVATGDGAHRLSLFQANYPPQYAGWPFGVVGTELTFQFYKAMDALKAWRESK
eukprot:CFRG5645T1